MSDTDVQLHGAILHVDDLARAIDFYTRLLDLPVIRRSSDAAVLSSPARFSTIALRERRGQRSTDRTVEALVWHIPTLESLGQVEQRLQRLDAKVVQRNTYEERFTLLSARDPEGQRLVFFHHEGVEEIPRDIPAEVFWY